MIYKFFDKEFAGRSVKSIINQQVPGEPHKRIIRKFNEIKIYLSFKDNIWGADLADMQLLSKFNKGSRFLLCVIDIYSKYAWVISLKVKKV